MYKKSLVGSHYIKINVCRLGTVYIECNKQRLHLKHNLNFKRSILLPNYEPNELNGLEWA